MSRLTALNTDLAGTDYDLSIGTSANPIACNPASEITSVTRTNDAYAFVKGNGSTGYTSDGLNRYMAAGASSLTYDANGNLTGDGTWTYGYDVENKLTSAAGAGKTANLTYDPLGRLSQIGGSVDTTLLHDGLADRDRDQQQRRIRDSRRKQ